MKNFISITPENAVTFANDFFFWAEKNYWQKERLSGMTPEARQELDKMIKEFFVKKAAA